MCILLGSLSAVPKDNGLKFFRLADLISSFQKFKLYHVFKVDIFVLFRASYH